MTCLEAQSKIIAYIDNKIDKEDKLDFLLHIRHCKNCREELDIYYTMIEGMRQLDSNQPLSKDFSAELEARMERDIKKNRKKKDFYRSSICVVIMIVFGFVLVGYVNFLHILHADEQQKLKEAQGDYYYSSCLESHLFELEQNEFVRSINMDVPQEEPDFYKKIRQYRMLKQD